ncbi:MAG: Crp/Fnr family transcriptional regulator [Cytophagaceae bacterium]|nr:Crp/Fnr family transcriptional regulator [Cytophagaceae bacterium]MBK9508830.1 Crp/Fnr family transcriptional regulator [Cytophagaceae bacterium]MBK9935735.1 Crp/Fnr family transcriptional regulator [Cytophagaceae bacterium]MBL0304237.1 Crp/Fnr family transcriptional regulator [Cytophagaceae bacterium]MBL0324996.1 Crp/Fnr family transcriptional regulator [Cytophagaceae bacterium]
MQLTEYLKKHIAISSELSHIIDQSFEIQEFDIHEYLLKTGEVSDKIYFIESGVVREFSDTESESGPESEKVITYWILPENEWIYQVESFELQIASHSNIRAETKVNARSISKALFEKLISQNAELFPHILSIYRKYLLQLEYRNRMHQLRKVEDRLIYLDNMHPGLSQKVPLYMIASYLNTTATNLSRVRGKAIKTKKE